MRKGQFKCVNLDCADDAKLRRVKNKLADPRHDYARLLLIARCLRRGGAIEEALITERAAEIRFRLLPPALKW